MILASLGLTALATTSCVSPDQSRQDIESFLPKNGIEEFIVEKLEMYNSTWKNERTIKHLSSDMAIPEDKL